MKFLLFKVSLAKHINRLMWMLLKLDWRKVFGMNLNLIVVLYLESDILFSKAYWKNKAEVMIYIYIYNYIYTHTH